MFTLKVYNCAGKEIGTVDLNQTVFSGVVNEPLLHEVIQMYRANLRQGTASTKKRGEVSGGNKKPWRQKGTGKARVGSSRSPLWRKGGVVFGPVPRDYSYQMPKKMKNGALCSSLNSRLNDNLVKVLEAYTIDTGKTRDFVGLLDGLGMEREKTLMVCDQPQELLLRACRNVPHVTVERWQNLTALDVLKSKHLLITAAALEHLTERLEKGKA